ncbi:DUF4145 domain-containing protein [Bradyrhizobium sp. 168]|uniref:DUF4145 domain-containing protein n=1 Tax=Bradyrhizobium sp. 168 TaxID=2782639 RepID=UPI001FFBD1AA|nr:DUF4145 domain-containing protein [Bradyrhizobium sp. 168]MCK1583224.1 DUF4145 domain-containing protein [Bradyrhizobium sp. 168]
MATFTHKCPHCLTEHIALRIHPGQFFHSHRAGVHLDCPKCAMPSAALLQVVHGLGNNPRDWNEDDDVTDYFKVKAFWPQPPGPVIPENMPTDVERIYLQAERNLPIEGNEEAAGTMYRKALDVGLKKIDPDMKGMLAARIKKLAADGKLTVDIAEWADHVRDLGNDAAHEEEPPTREELTDLRNFTEMVMRYLFSLPALVQARKPKPAKPEK